MSPSVRKIKGANVQFAPKLILGEKLNFIFYISTPVALVTVYSKMKNLVMELSQLFISLENLSCPKKVLKHKTPLHKII